MADKKTLKFPNGSAWICVSDGVVTQDKKWSETYVSGGGGGARVLNNTVYVDPVNVRSTVSEQMEFWIQEDDGSEMSVRFSDVNFAVRPGQRVRVAWGASGRHERGGFLYAHNYASRESVSMVSNWYDWARKQGLTKPPALYRLMTTWLSLAIAMLLSLAAIAAFADKRVPEAGPAAQGIERIASYVRHGGSRGEPMQVQELTQLATDTFAFASSGLSKVETLWAPGRKSEHTQHVFLGIGIGLVVWLPLLLVFHLVGALVFHIWWRAAQHKLIGRRVRPLFGV